MLSAMVADYIKTLWRILACGRLFRTAFGAPLRRHHIPLIEDFLFFFGKKKSLSTLNTRRFYIRHRCISFLLALKGEFADSST